MTQESLQLRCRRFIGKVLLPHADSCRRELGECRNTAPRGVVSWSLDVAMQNQSGCDAAFTFAVRSNAVLTIFATDDS